VQHGKIVLGFALAFAIGVLCRMAGVPLPAPPALMGALLVVAMTIGYIVTDRVATHRACRHRPLCGGPSGTTKGARP
jgi:XapX domain-containing protein